MSARRQSLARPRLRLLPFVAVVVDAPILKKLQAIRVIRGANLIQVLESRIDGRATAHLPYPYPRIDRLAEQQRCDCRAAPKQVPYEGSPYPHCGSHGSTVSTTGGCPDDVAAGLEHVKLGRRRLPCARICDALAQSASSTFISPCFNIFGLARDSRQYRQINPATMIATNHHGPNMASRGGLTQYRIKPEPPPIKTH